MEEPMQQPEAQPGMQPEQAAPGQITADQLKNMTPEQIRELQKQNCIFCHIINGKVQSRKIYEDDNVFAILDINPASPGHILLLPKEHHSIMPQIKENEIGYMFMLAKALSNACLRALKCHGTNIFVANGVAAGQKAPHFMIHIIPRKDGDGITSFNLKKSEISEQELDEMQKKLKKAADDILGIEKKEPIDLDTSKEEKEDEHKDEESKEEDKGEDKKGEEEAKESSDSDIGLDDIARVLGGGK